MSVENFSATGTEDLEGDNPTNWQELETICLEGCCPSCGLDALLASEYPSDDEVWFECQSCAWNSTHRLSDAREAGYCCEQLDD